MSFAQTAFPSIITTSLPTAVEYASIPDVHNVKGLFGRRQDVVEAIDQLMKAHGVTEKFVLFALHKHFDVHNGSVLLQQPINLPGGRLGEVVHPIPAEALNPSNKPELGLQTIPVAFMVVDGKLQPYKFAFGHTSGVDFAATEEFFRAFISTLNDLNATGEFALKLPNVTPTISMSEGEIPERQATVLVPSSMMPVGEDNVDEQFSASFGPLALNECSKKEVHSSKTNGMHTVFVGATTGPSAGVYEAAVAAMDKVALNATSMIAVA